MHGQCPQWRLLVVALMMTSAVSVLAAKTKKCPSAFCACTGKSVDCSNHNSLQIPDGIPDGTKVLSLAGNKLLTVDNAKLRRLKKLRSLDLSNNNIEEIQRDAFSGLKSLRFLQLAENQLQHLPHDVFELLKGLENLDLSNNDLKSVEGTFVNMSRILQLDLSNNHITHLTARSFKGLSNLQYLNLESNNISRIDVLAFWDMTSLRQLVLRNNFLQQADGLFVENPDLQSLDLANTHLQSFPQVLPLHIEVLHLDQNNISTIRRGDTIGYIRLRTLMLYENSLTLIEDDCFANMQDLQELWLNMNNLKEIPVGLPASLHHLSLDNNKVSVINSNDFPANSNLQILSLQSNAITRLEKGVFRNVASLNELFLGGNSFSVFANNVFSPLSNLQNLNLLRFDLDLIEENAFNGLSNLKSLDLSYILMKSPSGIQGNIFKWLPNLTTLALQESPYIASKLISSREMLSSISSVQDLNLMDNTITSLSLTLLSSLKQLKSIKLPGNPFHCDSLLRWLQDFIKLERTKFFMPYDILCHTPIELRGQPLVDVQYSDFVPATTTTLLPKTTTLDRNVDDQSNKTIPIEQSNYTSHPQMTSIAPVVNTTVANVTIITSAHKGNDDNDQPEEENFMMITVATSISTAAIIIVVAVVIIVIFHRRRFIQRDFEYCRENEVEFYVSDGSDRPPVKLTREERQSRGSVTSKAEEDITNELDLSMRVYTWDDGEQ
ncbi:slit homolog 3 protein-like [Mizuhopecten yessoensis]|uniref:Insulin-like growth factor-binding protein complex acid labile subunit n=1 Tax=Mizuhopecten yessoensis TaxID=6573 RepID=A0A210QW13_MIZYE|nr:slit homolog 3 protein-like [Mizuhopecten yessoensis]OWF52915.1 Insulin-like growth factor-binding protein complex acid labile subunit [Mizuhopecten yessoensis]